jgi:hypothetical protein
MHFFLGPGVVKLTGFAVARRLSCRLVKGLLRHFLAESAREAVAATAAAASATAAANVSSLAGHTAVSVEPPSPEPTIADGAYGFFADVYKVLSMPIQVVPSNVLTRC